MDKVKKTKTENQMKKIENIGTFTENTADDENNSEQIETPPVLEVFQRAEKAKKKRRFKRKYLQPQPKKSRKRKARANSRDDEDLPEGWNGVIKNISGIPVTKYEESLFLKGKKFCPVEKDPPVLRMQRELNQFYRNLRIEWFFYGQKDGRSELEKRFYPKSQWNPPKACIEIENYISRIQEHFDKWKPPRKVKDNLTKEERKVLKSVRENDDIVYMWEDKGPSFVKMTREQYEKAGNKELENAKFYEEVLEDTCKEAKKKNDDIVDSMLMKDEIPLRVAEFLKGGRFQVANYYHLLNTHKIPTTIEDPEEWLTENGFPIRGIVSGIGTPTERLSGFVDFFLQPGMKNLDSFLRDGKHTLQVIEKAGNKELENAKFYEEVLEDTCKEAKKKNDDIVDSMLMKDEIPLRVAEFLKGGRFQVANYYHLLNTHKIPTTIEDPEEWLTENGFPIRGIVSGIGTPTERLSGFVDFFLQPGMKNLDSFLRDGKHTLQVIEETNERIQSGEISLDGVALVSLDVEAMYNNMTRDLGTQATKDFLESRMEKILQSLQNLYSQLLICV